MGASIKLGKIWGIPVGLHPSWFIIFFLLTWSLSTGYFPREYGELSLMAHIVLGVLTTILFFASVLAHELGHSFLALRNRIAVKGITLFIFGGVAQIAEEPKTPGAEFRIAIAGPLVSLALAILFGIAYLLDQQIPYLAAPSAYLMRINFILAVFNLIPGFPLDGGRVLRAFVWWLNKDFYKATKVASFSGQIVAFGFIGFGVLSLFRGDFMNGVWLVFIGWFLQNAAATAYAQTNMQHQLQDVRVEQVMERDCVRVASLTPVSLVVDNQVLTDGQSCFFVADNGKLQGLLTLRDISQIPQPKWRFTTMGQAMVPAERLVSVTPDTELLKALQTMDDANLAQMPVLENGNLVGVLTRENVLHYLRVRAELKI
jgi:Zn-dependent protease